MRQALAIWFLLAATSSAAVIPTGLAALAASPDGKLLAVAGQNRVIYLLDAEKLEVKSRLWLGVRIAELAFPRDAGRLLVADEINQLHLVDLKAGKAVQVVQRVEGLLLAGELLLTRDLAEAERYRLRLLSPQTLEELGELDLPDRPVTWRLDATGKQLIVLGASKAGDEPKVELSEIPSELRGLERWSFRQRNDGREATLYQFDLATRKLVGQATTWYTSDTDSTRLARLGDMTYVFNRVNQCARIDATGKTKPFETAQAVNHALEASQDGKLLYLGGLGGGSVGPIEDGTRIAFKLDELPGQAEFINRFLVLPDGNAWAVTSACRLVQLTRTGRVVRVVPVF